MLAGTAISHNRVKWVDGKIAECLFCEKDFCGDLKSALGI